MWTAAFYYDILPFYLGLSFYVRTKASCLQFDITLERIWIFETTLFLCEIIFKLADAIVYEARSEFGKFLVYAIQFLTETALVGEIFVTFFCLLLW